MRYIKQEGLRDCGICCLYNIIRYYGGNIDIEKLRKMTNTNENGTSIYNIVTTASLLGFKSKAYKCTINDLFTQTYPLILYVKLNEFNHFVILEKIENDKIFIFDPIKGKITYTFLEFKTIWQGIIITFIKEKEIIKETTYYNHYLLSIIKTYKKQIIIITILSFLCTLLSILLSLIIKNTFDSKIDKYSSFLFLFLLLFKCVIDYIKSILSVSLNNNIDYKLSEKIYDKIFSLPLFYHHSRPVGDVVSKINDIYSLENFISLVTLSSILDIISILFILFTSLFINFRFFILILIISFIYFSIYYFDKNEQKKRINIVKDDNSISNSNFIENIIGIDTINNLNISNNVIKKQKELKKTLLKSYYKFMHLLSLQTLLFNLVESYGIYLIMFIGAFLIKKDKITIGDLSMFYSLILIYFSSLKNIITLDKSYVDSKIAFNKVNSLLNYEDVEDGKVKIKSINNICFENITYSYSGNNIISNLNLDIKKGENLFLAGKSGVGKSTLLKLLLKELNLKEGNILINGESINNINIDSIRNNICYVSQDEYIFTDSIKNNIIMYKNIKTKELNKVLKVTMLDKVLKRRNVNLDYLLEENGHNISAGERQRILLARALLRNTDFIILDETMNEIDIDSERKILERIIAEYNKTIILVSHRNSNIDLFDKRVVI